MPSWPRRVRTKGKCVTTLECLHNVSRICWKVVSTAGSTGSEFADTLESLKRPYSPKMEILKNRAKVRVGKWVFFHVKWRFKLFTFFGTKWRILSFGEGRFYFLLPMANKMIPTIVNNQSGQKNNPNIAVIIAVKHPNPFINHVNPFPNNGGKYAR